MRTRCCALARAFPWTVRILWACAAVFIIADAGLLARRVLYARETARLRQAMTTSERERVDVALAADSNRVAAIVELARRDARGDERLHLSVALDSGRMHLEQQGAILRTMTVEIGSDRWEHRATAPDSVLLTAPRGARTIERLIGDSAVALSGGGLIYARTAADHAAANPGTVRVSAADFRVLVPNLKLGQRVYFY